jgi:hypothetical protein
MREEGLAINNKMLVVHITENRELITEDCKTCQ